MIFQIRVLEGIFRPNKHFTYFSKASTIRGFWFRLILLLISYIVIAGVCGYLGIGTEEIMQKMGNVSKEKLEWAKVIFGLGGVLQSILYPLWFMLLFSVAFSLYVDGLSYFKLLVLQIYPAFILLFEYLINTIIYIFSGIPYELSLFSLSPIVQLLTDEPLILALASKTTLFQLWTLIIQLTALKISTEDSYWKLIPFIVLLYVLFNSLSAIAVVVIQDLTILL